MEKWFRYYSMALISCNCLFALTGILGNVFSLLIFLHKDFRKISINILLAFLSFCHLTLSLMAFPVFTTGPIAYFYPFFRLININATVYVYPVAMMFHSAAIWLLIAISFERWVAVCRPLFVSMYCTRKRALLAVLLVVVVSISYNFCRFWEFSINEKNQLQLEIRLNAAFMLYYETIANLLCIYLLPLSIITTFSILIALELRRSALVRRRMSRRQSTNVEPKVSMMLLYVVVLFVACYTMSLVLNLIETIEPEIFTGEIGYVLSDLNNMLVIINASTTTFLYLRFSSRYRSRLCHIIGRMLGCEQLVVGSSTVQNGSVHHRLSMETMSCRSVNPPRNRSQTLPLGSPNVNSNLLSTSSAISDELRSSRKSMERVKFETQKLLEDSPVENVVTVL